MRNLLTVLCLWAGIAAHAQNVVQAEYFLDADAGIGKNTTINFPQGYVLPIQITVDLNGISTGIHNLFIRTRDSMGQWSLTVKRRIEVLQTIDKINITEREYFFDEDPGFAKGTRLTVSPQDSSLIRAYVENVAAGMPAGMHKLYERVKDNNGNWSMTTLKNAEVIKAAGKTNIVGGEYFFDEDPGFSKATPVNVSTPDSILTGNFLWNTAGLQAGYHKLYTRFTDSNGRWSQTVRRNVEVVKSLDSGYVVSAEYFFTTDAGFGNCAGSALTPLQDGAFAFNIPLGQVPVDSGTLFIRVKDGVSMNWSLTKFKKFPDFPFPLTLLSFTAAKENDHVLLKWLTTHEFNSAYFELERSSDGINFKTMGRVNAKGNNTIQNVYDYTDNIAGILSDKVFYRLKIVDKNGSFSFSDIKQINIESAGNVAVLYPNPVNDILIIKITKAVAKLQLKITDVQGRIIKTIETNTTGLTYADMRNLNRGTYFIEGSDGKEVLFKKKVVKQ